MIKLIVTGHGNFASGLLSNVSLITGVPEACTAFDFTFDISPDQLEEKIADCIDENEGTIIFTDLLNGTPFNVSARHAIGNDHVKLVYGVNAAMLLETVMRRNTVSDLNELAEAAVETGRKQIGVFELVEKEYNEDEDL